MINNLTIAGRQYDYGYDIYYVTRKEESIAFPSNSAIVAALNPLATNYTVKSVPMQVKMNIKGTLKSYSYTDGGWLSKVAKHFDYYETIDGDQVESSNSYDYQLAKYPVVTGALKGSIYNNGIKIQTFMVELGTTELTLTDINEPSTKVVSGSYLNNNESMTSKITLNWNNTPNNSDNYVVVNYKYESSNTYSVLTKNEPMFDEYNFVDLYGSTTLDTKYVKILSTFKCLYKTKSISSYTNTSSKIFYTRCKAGQSLCSARSGAYVPAMTVCNERLF